jgi:hypothetical protein
MKDKICPLMSRMVPVAGGLSGQMQLQLAGVPCCGLTCGFWSEKFNLSFDPEKDGQLQDEGRCAFVAIADEYRTGEV